MPYISSSIIVQLLTAVFPQLQKMRSEGESGSRKIAKITRYLAIAIAFVQASSYLGSYAKDYLTQQNTWTYFTALISLVAGAFFVIWLADRITEKGLGNGASVIMLAGILSRFPQAFMVNFLQRIGSIPLLVLELFLFSVIVFLAVLLSTTTRKVPILFAKKISTSLSSENTKDFLPFKLNFSGVMPVIFAQTVLVIPAYFVSKFDFQVLVQLSNPFSFAHGIAMIVLIFGFSYLYSALVFNPNNMAEDLKRSGVFIPGVQPGLDTANYIDQVVFNLILPGASFLAALCLMPSVARLLGITPEFSLFFGGTSLLIVIGVALELMTQLNALALQVEYNKFSRK